MSVLSKKRLFGEDLIKEREQLMMFAAHHEDFHTAIELAERNRHMLKRMLRKYSEGDEAFKNLTRRIRTYDGIIEALNNGQMP